MIPEHVVLVTAIFILGTYAVATLDDLVWMKASRSFIYIWGAIALVLLYFRRDDEMLWLHLAIAAFVLLAFRTGLVLGVRTAWGDIIAMMPAIMLLPPLNSAGFLVLVYVFDKIALRFFYAKILRRNAYPFMPAILVGMLLSIIILLQTSDIPLERIKEFFSAAPESAGQAVNASGGGPQ